MPDLLLMANLCALMGGSVWLLLASWFGLPVSTSHSLIGAMLGCGISISIHSINWSYITKILTAWLFSPIIAFFTSIFYFSFVRHYCLRSSRGAEIALRSLWLIIFFICSAFFVSFAFSSPFKLYRFNTPLNQLSRTYPLQVVGIAFAAGAALTFLVAPLCYWRAFYNLSLFDITDLPESSNASSRCGGGRNSASTLASLEDESIIIQTPKIIIGETRGKWEPPWKIDLHTQAYQEDHFAEQLCDFSEKFEPRLESLFASLQVISASLACLVHGSNDVSNAAAPYSAVYAIYRSGTAASSVPLWILALAGASISLGLTFLGHKVIKKVGIKLLHISPSRGFCIEMAMATVMIVGTSFGLPLSTTHVAVGAMVGVGILDKHIDPLTKNPRPGTQTLKFFNLKALNWKIVSKIALAWAGTMCICGTISALLFSFAIYSPTRVHSRYTPLSMGHVYILAKE